MSESSALSLARHAHEKVEGDTVALSVVVPFYNEEENLPVLEARLSPILDKVARTWEVLLIDDGSTDNSFAVAATLHQADPRYKVVQFRRNFGKTAALMAGFDLAVGEVIVAMDADLQTRPEDIPRLIEKLDQGYDLVSGWRKNRQDGALLRKFPSRVANALARKMTGLTINDFGAPLKAYRRDLVKELHLYTDQHRFIPVAAHMAGAKIAEIEVEFPPRERGKSKYGLGRTGRVLLDLLSLKFFLFYSEQPLRLFGGIGGWSSLFGIAILAYLTVRKFVFADDYDNHLPLFALGILSILLGVQVITLGLMAEMQVRVYHECQNKPLYTVRRTLL